MDKDNVFKFQKQGEKEDSLIQAMKEGAWKMLASAVEEEVSEYLLRFSSEVNDEGHRGMVCNSHLPGRTLHTSLGDLPIQVP